MKLHTFLLTAFIAGTFSFGQEYRRIELRPMELDIHLGSRIPGGAFQIDALESSLLLRYPKDAFVTLVNGEGSIIRTIGNRGEGPGEIRGGVLAMAVAGKHLWLLDRGDRRAMRHFVDGIFVENVPIISHNINMAAVNTNRFAGSEKGFVYPCSPAEGRLAYYYPIDGSPKPIGDLLFDRRDMGLLEKIPAMNDTIWYYRDKHWYALFKYFPLILKFDMNLEQAGAYSIKHQIVREIYDARVTDYEPKRFRTNAPAVFYDFQVLGDSIFVLAPRTLIRLSLHDGAITGIYRFFGKGEAFKGTDLLNLLCFAIMDDGRLFMSGVVRWGGDLLVSRLEL